MNEFELIAAMLEDLNRRLEFLESHSDGEVFRGLKLRFDGIVKVVPEKLRMGEVSMREFQVRVEMWLARCFGIAIAADTIERNHRFLEEALELVQACGCTSSEAHQLVDYVFSRPTGEKKQEVGGVCTTLNALCSAHGIIVEDAANAELLRNWGNIDKIRAKQAAKPKHSPLP